MEIHKIIVLVDYRGAFYSSTKNNRTLSTINVIKFCKYLKEFNYDVEVSEFSQLDVCKDYSNVLILPTSSEDYGLLYKGYIEDILIALHFAGAILVPSLALFRAHHNKLEMELLRNILIPEQAKLLQTMEFGTYEEFLKAHNDGKIEEGVYVVKSAFGAGSRRVFLAHNYRELKKITKKVSRSIYVSDIIREYRRRILWNGYIKASLHRNKFIIQKYIDNLDGDFKVLKYGDKYYPLYRNNRKNDFRASGSGLLDFDITNKIDVKAILSFAMRIANCIGTPLCSMDIAFVNNCFYLLEYQCVCFGTYAAERSEGYWIYKNGWNFIKNQCDIEKVMCEAIVNYINKNE